MKIKIRKQGCISMQLIRPLNIQYFHTKFKINKVLHRYYIELD